MSVPRDREQAGKGLTGRHVLAALLAFFACILLVNGVFVFAALDSWSGLTSKHAYQQGLAFNDELEAAAEQRALGWELAVAAAPRLGAAWRLSARFRDAGGRPIDGLLVRVELLRPTREGLDQSFDLARAGAGLYAGDFTPAAPGNWDAVVTASRRGAVVYRREQRLWLK